MIKEKIGLTIRDLRENKKYSKEFLANISNVDRNYLTGIENGKRNVSVEILERILKALDISVTDFFKKDIFLK
jgi:transcriptional regulator with XRE-family HTH domain